MKKSFKILLLAVMALCLAASASFAVTKGYDAITSAAKTAAANIAKSSSTASTDVAIVSLIHTLAAASTNTFNEASKDAEATEADLTVLHAVAVKLATALSGDLGKKYVDPISKDAGEDLEAAFVKATAETLNKEGSTTLSTVSKDSVSTDGKTLLVKAAAEFKNVDFGTTKRTVNGKNANAALYVYSKFFTKGVSAEDAASKDISAFYEAAAENSDAFKDMLPKISAFLEKNSTATPLDMLKEVAAFSNPFVSADVKVYANGTLSKTISVSSDVSADTVYVDLGSKVSLDIALSTDVLGVSEDSTALTLSGDCYTLSNDFATSGDKAVVTITFASGDTASYVFKLTVIASGDSKTTTTETYLLKVSDITLTPANAVSNTAKLISADTDNYSATLDLTNLNSTASGDWGSFADFTVSSDYLGGSFSVTVSTDAKLVNVYVKNGTAWDAVDTEEVSGKVITPNTIGTYKVVLSADLVASSDKTVSGDAYFAFDFTVASVDAPKSNEDVVTDAVNASADATGGVGGNPIIASGQKIDTKFLSGTQISASAFASFFSSATTVTMLSETEIVEALDKLGLDESYMGNAEEGYKALAFGLPSGFTLTANEKFFVLLTTNENGTGTNYLGIGVVPPALDGSSTMVIVFRLLKNPAHTADYMTFNPGEYYVGATNDTASADTTSPTRAVFVTAGGTFNIKSEEATLLQGQTASGTATPVADSGDDDDNQETSSHGSSSGCDAGFGALALLAVAGALAARKVRK